MERITRVVSGIMGQNAHLALGAHLKDAMSQKGSVVLCLGLHVNGMGQKDAPKLSRFTRPRCNGSNADHRSFFRGRISRMQWVKRVVSFLLWGCNVKGGTGFSSFTRPRCNGSNADHRFFFGAACQGWCHLSLRVPASGITHDGCKRFFLCYRGSDVMISKQLENPKRIA